jgi:hypothetical protein
MLPKVHSTHSNLRKILIRSCAIHQSHQKILMVRYFWPPLYNNHSPGVLGSTRPPKSIGSVTGTSNTSSRNHSRYIIALQLEYNTEEMKYIPTSIQLERLRKSPCSMHQVEAKALYKRRAVRLERPGTKERRGKERHFRRISHRKTNGWRAREEWRRGRHRRKTTFK